MRNRAAAAVALLLAACSHPMGSRPGPAPSASPAAPTSSTPVLVPTTPPGAGTPLAAVIAWVQAGRAADVATYHTAARNGVTTALGDDVAFTSGQSRCMTDSRHSGGALACLVKLTDPPPPPPNTYTQWVGDWVDFDGASITVGGLHGDPGRFTAGDGPPLAYGSSLKFGDYQCRSEQLGLYCVDFAHQSAAGFSAAGVVAFGCTKPATTPPDVGEKFVC